MNDRNRELCASNSPHERPARVLPIAAALSLGLVAVTALGETIRLDARQAATRALNASLVISAAGERRAARTPHIRR